MSQNKVQRAPLSRLERRDADVPTLASTHLHLHLVTLPSPNSLLQDGIRAILWWRTHLCRADRRTYHYFERRPPWRDRSSPPWAWTSQSFAPPDRDYRESPQYDMAMVTDLDVIPSLSLPPLLRAGRHIPLNHHPLPWNPSRLHSASLRLSIPIQPRVPCFSSSLSSSTGLLMRQTHPINSRVARADHHEASRDSDWPYRSLGRLCPLHCWTPRSGYHGFEGREASQALP